MIGSFEPGICLMMTRVQDDWLFWPWNLIHTLKVVGQGKQAEYLIRKDKVKVPENLPKGDYILSFRWKLYFPFLIRSRDLNLIWFQKVGRRGSCTSVGLVRFCQTCLRIRIMKLKKETIRRNIWFDLSLWVLSSLFDLAKSQINREHLCYPTNIL